MIYDLAIIGAGPAGIAAGVYAARKKLKTVFITKNFENQSAVSDNIQNWIGTVSIQGAELAKNLENHLRAYAKDSVDIKNGETATELKKERKTFKIKTNKDEYTANAVLIATGSSRKKLSVKGAEQFENKGITYCATCDAPFFEGMDVAVIGGGNAAFETALQLIEIAKSVTILQRTKFKADQVTTEKVLANPKVKGYENVDLIEIKGDKFVSTIVYKDKNTGETKELPVGGIFVEIGATPSVDFLKTSTIKLNEFGQIITDSKNQRTSENGIWAAGDCTDGLYHQNNIATGDAVKALEDIYYYLREK
jgi:alkyl hydroperoxide reductase subunit F